MSEYRVIITETLKRAVTVEAESREEAEEAVRRQYQNSEHILVAEDFDGVSFSAQYPEQQVELPYGKMKELFRKAERAGIHVCGYITFMQDCFTAQYSERSRTYAVSSGNKAFQPNMGGYSVYGSCLDGTDPCVRLEQYMAVERGGEKGWSDDRLSAGRLRRTTAGSVRMCYTSKQRLLGTKGSLTGASPCNPCAAGRGNIAIWRNEHDQTKH